MSGETATNGPRQMATITALISNPAAEHVETASRDWIIAGLRPADVSDHIDDDSTFTSVIGRAQATPGAYSVIAIDTQEKKRVRAYRGLVSTYDVFYARRPSDDALVVADHFKNVLAELPVSNRTATTAAQLDQLLVGTHPAGAPVAEVGRLGHGERLDWHADSEPQTTLVETLEADRRRDPVTAKRRIDERLRDSLGDEPFEEPVATMLSGGVDSTLLHTYLGTDQSVSGAIDSPEFQFEIEYARDASNLLDTEHEMPALEEDEFLEYVETTIDATGLPPKHPQDPLIYYTIAETPYRTYPNGSFGDSMFGTGTAALAHLAQYLGRTSDFLPELTWEVEGLKKTAQRLRRPATDPDGAAMNFEIHADLDFLAEMFGREAVHERKQARLQYVADRIEVDDSPGYGPHMHLGHAIDFFQSNVVSLWRHGAHASGASMPTPYASHGILETALSVPPKRRYARFTLPPRSNPTRVVQYKYLLKDLLAERVPEYNTKKRKGHSFLPVQRYLDEGPLADAFETYAVPTFIPTQYRDQVRNGTGHISWYALGYAIWRDRVLENDSLDRLDVTTVIER